MLCNYIFVAWHIFILHIIQPYSLLILYRMKPKQRTIIHTKEHARRQKCNCIGLFPYGKVHKLVGVGTVFRQRYRLHYRQRHRSAECSMPTPTRSWTSVTCSILPPLHYAMRHSARPPKRGTVTCNHWPPSSPSPIYKNRERSHPIGQLLSLKTAATYSPTNAVPSARSGLTSLFGMGRGGTPTL